MVFNYSVLGLLLGILASDPHLFVKCFENVFHMHTSF
ncbi:unnamed protein product [Linum tenue]|uniref:NADH dehydrogenase subunit 4 n=1 Tax=Linum tenue TaxID=586396 RepID=A0AAV0HE05_9ROSI|nr:unnamed protein product [Linum tenue]